MVSGLAFSIGAAVISAGVAYYIPPLVLRWTQAASIRKRARGRVALTFDDGPDNDLTPRVLDVLASYDVRATFFFVGIRAANVPAVCNRTVREGHEVGTHSNRHRNAWRIGPRLAVWDALEGHDALKPWVRSDAIFRPPFGKTTTPVMLSMRARRVRTVWWTHVAGDTYVPIPDPEQVAEKVLSEGGVILMHSRHISAERQEYLLRLLTLLLEGAGAKGIRFCVASEFLRGA